MQAIDIVQVTSDGWVENGPQNIGGGGKPVFSGQLSVNPRSSDHYYCAPGEGNFMQSGEGKDSWFTRVPKAGSWKPGGNGDKSVDGCISDNSANITVKYLLTYCCEYS